jgi:predicted neuraminidase
MNQPGAADAAIKRQGEAGRGVAEPRCGSARGFALPEGSSRQLLVLAILSTAAAVAAETPLTGSPILKSEFIYQTAPFPECHASTLAESKGTLVAAWFGGTREKHPDVAIWVSRHVEGKWTVPVEAANGVQEDGRTRHPCWNPVLFQGKEGPLLLFYKVGPNPSRWWGMMVTSSDTGITWSKPRRLPVGMLGPIKNKPVQLANGSLLCPSSTEDDGWRIHLERTPDLGQTWNKTGSLNDPKEFGAIQPTILFHPGNQLQLLCRSRQQRITECWSDDGGTTWSAMKATALPNPNSGIDAVTLKDNRCLLVYNPVTRGRTPLVIALSSDGRNWKDVVTLESQPGEYSYPAIIQTSDGLVHVSYTWKREKIRHVVLDPARLPSGN